MTCTNVQNSQRTKWHYCLSLIQAREGYFPPDFQWKGKSMPSYSSDFFEKRNGFLTLPCLMLQKRHAMLPTCILARPEFSGQMSAEMHIALIDSGCLK